MIGTLEIRSGRVIVIYRNVNACLIVLSFFSFARLVLRRFTPSGRAGSSRVARLHPGLTTQVESPVRLRACPSCNAAIDASV